MKVLKWLIWRFFGGWRVVYPDGQVSTVMAYRSAVNYAAIFGGRAVPSYEVK